MIPASSYHVVQSSINLCRSTITFHFRNVKTRHCNHLPFLTSTGLLNRRCKATAIVSINRNTSTFAASWRKSRSHRSNGRRFYETEGPEPLYDKVNSGYKIFHSKDKFKFFKGGEIPELVLAYETWGELNENKDNTILLFTGLSPSSHAKSHQENSNPGWWEAFIGPGCALNTDQFHVICVNVIGGCYGSSGPSSINPLTGKHYGTTFPCITVQDIVKSQFLLLDYLGIEKTYACVGSSLGGMSSLLAAALFPERVKRLVSISACSQSHPSAIAQRHIQRQVLMSDPNWNKGFYYEGTFPSVGMKNARSIATISYRSGKEWGTRFGRKKIENDGRSQPCGFAPEFMIEHYLDHQIPNVPMCTAEYDEVPGRKWKILAVRNPSTCSLPFAQNAPPRMPSTSTAYLEKGESFALKYDPNSLLYISKAMDLFDLSEGCSSLVDGIKRITCPTLIMGVQSDLLFPIEQQRELDELFKESGNQSVAYFELPSIYGHDTFLLDVTAIAAAIKGHLETDLTFTKRKPK